MRVLKADNEGLDEALRVLEEGGVVAYPTETFYALGARYDDGKAIERVYSLKQRPHAMAVSLIVGEKDAVSKLASSLSGKAEKLIREFWPGPLTLVLKAREGLNERITYKNTVAVRMPGASFGLELARAFGLPITATSANPSGSPPPDSAETVMEYFGEGIDLLVDGGATPGGLPSTIVDVTGETLRIIRHGVLVMDEEGPKEKALG